MVFRIKGEMKGIVGMSSQNEDHLYHLETVSFPVQKTAHTLLYPKGHKKNHFTISGNKGLRLPKYILAQKVSRQARNHERSHFTTMAIMVLPGEPGGSLP